MFGSSRKDAVFYDAFRGNDAQKTMGVIVAALVATGRLTGEHGAAPKVPLWVVLSCHGAMAIGTAFGGWRIVKTVGTKPSKLTRPDGFCAEFAGTLTLMMDTLLGIPVSTTHAIAGAIVGVASARRARSIHWRIAEKIGWAWLATIPGAALISACALFGLKILGIAI